MVSLKWQVQVGKASHEEHEGFTKDTRLKLLATYDLRRPSYGGY